MPTSLGERSVYLSVSQTKARHRAFHLHPTVEVNSRRSVTCVKTKNPINLGFDSDSPMFRLPQFTDWQKQKHFPSHSGRSSAVCGGPRRLYFCFCSLLLAWKSPVGRSSGMGARNADHCSRHLQDQPCAGESAPEGSPSSSLVSHNGHSHWLLCP